MDSLKISDIYEILEVPNLTDTTRHIDNRQNCGLIFAQNGLIHYKFNGCVYVSDCNHALFVPKGISYSLHCLEKSLSTVINFNLWSDMPWDTFHSFDISKSKGISGTLTRLSRIWNFKGQSYELRCMGMVYEIVAALNDIQDSLYFPIERYARILPSIDYMETHFNQPGITNELLAEKSGISTVYFRKLFAAKYGVSPMRYIQQRRIEEAQVLLRHGADSISEVAEMTGFGSVYHFSKAFKQAVGFSPSEYLKQRTDS